MGGEEHDAILRQAPEQVAKADALAGVQPHRRFVDDDDRRQAQQRARHGDALALAAGEGLDRVVGLLQQAHFRNQALHAPVAHVRRQIVEAGEVGQIFARREPARHPRVLWQIAEPAGEEAPQGAQRRTAEEDRAPGRVEDAGKLAQQRRLAGAVRPKDAHHAALHAKAHAGERLHRRCRQVQPANPPRPAPQQRARMAQRPAGGPRRQLAFLLPSGAGAHQLANGQQNRADNGPLHGDFRRRPAQRRHDEGHRREHGDGEPRQPVGQPSLGASMRDCVAFSALGDGAANFGQKTQCECRAEQPQHQLPAAALDVRGERERRRDEHRRRAETMHCIGSRRSRASACARPAGGRLRELPRREKRAPEGPRQAVDLLQVAHVEQRRPAARRRR